MGSVLGVHHAQITVGPGQEEAAREFYCTFLGLREIAKAPVLMPRGGFWMELGSVQVHVGQEADWDRSATKAHLAYRVSALESWRSRLGARGIVCKDGIPIPGMNRFEFRDPFGNRVEFLEMV